MHFIPSPVPLCSAQCQPDQDSPASLIIRQEPVLVWRQPLCALAALTWISFLPAPGVSLWGMLCVLLILAGYATWAIRRLRSNDCPMQARQLLVGSDGSARLSDSSGTLIPVTVLFTWRGSHRARIVFSQVGGQRSDWPVSRGAMGEAGWRSLCAWIAWLERGRVSKPPD